MATTKLRRRRSPLVALASAPCVRSLKIAQTIIDELAARGWRLTPIVAAPFTIADPGPHHPLVEAYRPDDPMPAERRRADPHDWESPFPDV